MSSEFSVPADVPVPRRPRSLPAWLPAAALALLASLVIAELVREGHPGLLLVEVFLASVCATALLAGRGGNRVAPVLLLAIGWLAMIAFMALLAGVLPFSESLDPGRTLREPALAPPDLSAAHPLGTDRHGLDLLGGLAHGAKVSLTVGIGATVLGGIVGGAIGMAAGFLRGRFEAVVNLLTDSMLAFPPLILLIAVVAVLDPSITVVTCALAVLTVPSYVRLARAYTITLAPREFVLAARAMGARRWRIVTFELLPNIFWPLVSFSMVVVAAMIVAEASLSYLGLSVQRPTPTWGNMIAAGQDTVQTTPHLVVVPAMAMFLTVLAMNTVGEALQGRFSGPSRNQ